ncbi:MAG: response regulator [Candidatus Rokubacteria bacterium]|nr:response regulator [Candidatus Rokubacteria bacterium]
MEPIRVLYVEDDRADQELTRRHFERHARQVKLRMVETVADALDQLLADDTDLVLADYRLPDGTGLALLDAIKTRGLRVPVVLVTGAGDVEAAVRLLKAGATDYVVKRPGYLATLPAVIEGAFRWFQSVREIRRATVLVLYAEHNRADAELTERAFREHGPHLQLDVVWSGQDALERLRAAPYDLFLLDYRMPDLSGIEILKALREERIRIPVVMITGRQDEEIAVQAFKLGVTDYLVKEEGYLTKLPSTIENVLAQRRLAEENEALLVLNSLAESIASVGEPSKLCQLVARAARDLLRADTSILWDVDGPELIPSGWAGMDEGAARALRTWADEQLLQRAATKRLVAVPDLLAAASGDPASAALLEDAGGTAAVSLVSAGRVTGVLAVASSLPREFSATEERLLTILADHAAIAFENARLYRQLRDRLAELQRTQAQLIQAEKLSAMGHLLAGVAHELNNPLAIVLGRATLLRDVVEGGPLAGQIEDIVQAGERCARIVRDFVSLARQRPAERHAVRLNDVVQDAVELLRYQLEVDNVEVTLELAGDLPVLWADPHQLYQVAVNLISNAHQALRDGAPPRRLSLRTLADPASARVVLEVADTGPGIPPDIQGRIFDPFFTTKPPGQGTGLGLSLCQAIVTGHDGSIRVESQPGQGALFRVELPVVAPPVPVSQVPSAEPQPPLSGRRILVVDDDEVLTQVLTDALSADGHHVETAPNGAVALQKLRGQAYDLILSDIKMPELDGPDLYREVERRYPELRRRFVLFTGDVLTPRTREFLKLTDVPSLIKPFALDDLQRIVQQVLRAE